VNGAPAGGRIRARFEALARENRAGFVAYVMAGDPRPDAAQRILQGLPAAGADLIELGIPFSDPMADGPPIQRAALRALAAGMTLAGVFDMVRTFRETDATTPIVLMGYMNPVVSQGFETFAEKAAAAGVDGLIAVDCPPEEADPLADALDRHGVDLIRLATPTTDDARLAIVARRTRGFVYYVSVAGVTGAKAAVAADVAPAVARVRAASGLPVAVGFGIRTPEQAAAIARVADAAVVGSALVEAVSDAVDAGADPAPPVLDLVANLGAAVREARKPPRG
jgi:tryptophan synthase alpha chain